jgi:hypothetical protein
MLGQPAALALQYFDKILCRSVIRKWGYFTVSTGPTRIGSFLKMFEPSLGKPAGIRYRKMLIFGYFEDIILWQSMANLPFFPAKSRNVAILLDQNHPPMASLTS